MASARFPASGATMGSPVITGQAVLLIPSGTPPTPTANTTPSSPMTSVNAGSLFDSSSPVTTVTIGVPPGVQANDELIAQILVYDGSGTNAPVIPTGWNLLRSDHIASGGNQLTSWLYFRIAGGSEPSSYNWSIAQQYAAGLMGAWRGGSGGIDASSGATASGNPATAAAPSLAPAHDGDLQVYFYGAQKRQRAIHHATGWINARANDRSSKEGFTLAFGDLPAPFMGFPSPTYNATGGGSGNVVMSAQAVLLIPHS